jgi:VanZ family protein
MFVGTHLPSVPMPGVSLSDKILHLGAFSILAMCLLTSWELTTGPLFATHQFLVALVCAVYGAFDEITQIPVGRSCELLDWLADVVGVAVGVLLFRYLRPLLYRLVLRSPQPSTAA